MKVLLLDDHALFREGLAYALSAINSELVLLQADSMPQAQKIIHQTPDLLMVLIDLDMPVNDGFEALNLFSTLYPSLPCVILSASTSRSDISQALENGALGFVSKNSSAKVLHQALTLILAGEIYVPHDIMHTERRVSNKARIKLSHRQIEVMSLVNKGYSNKVIARKLNIAEPTVKMHMSAIFKKLNVNNRSGAIAEIHKQRIPLIEFE